MSQVGATWHVESFSLEVCDLFGVGFEKYEESLNVFIRDFVDHRCQVGR
jgi:hypothetical protein